MSSARTSLVLASILALTLVAPQVAFCDAPSSASAAAPPPAWLIPGVPFVPWREAAGWTYDQKDILNPSYAAACGMILGRWGREPRSVEKGMDPGALPGWQLEDTTGAATLDRLKARLAQGIPVLVFAALTPIAHPLAGGVADGIEMGFTKAPAGTMPVGSYSNAMGKMVTLEGHRRLEKEAGTNPVREALALAARVAIGYDDARRVIILHDPTFGPAWELGYDDFERAWAASGHPWLVVHPAGDGSRADSARAAAPYRTRSADEQATEHYVYGYALSSSGDLAGGEKRFRDGLALPGISPGHRFLLSFELALNLGEQKRYAEAVAMAEQATQAVPQHPAPWNFLAGAYKTGKVPDAGKKAKEAKKHAEALMKDRSAMQALAAAIPCDFWVSNLAGLRGWCSR